MFQSTRPVRGATETQPERGVKMGVSIHAPRTGRDQRGLRSFAAQKRFNPRAPYGARHRQAEPPNINHRFNPRAPYGARPQAGADMQQSFEFQSTRPVRGATPPPAGTGNEAPHVSIHAPRTGRDCRRLHRTLTSSMFQSTRPVRGATNNCVGDGKTNRRFNPRAPYGARLC